MKNTVIVIAHNEGEHIQDCIESLLRQTINPEKIILIAHNCDDDTIEKASTYPVQIVEYREGDAPVHARLEALNHIDAENGNIFFIDGDAVADKNWIQEIRDNLNKNILVGTFVCFKGNIFESISNVSNYFSCIRGNPERWIWGASLAFHSKDSNVIKEILEKSIKFKTELGLTRYAEDFWIALFMSRLGRISITNKTKVVVFSKESNIIKSLKRNRENLKNGDIIQKYFDSLD